MAATQDGFLIDVLAVVLTVALALAAVYVLIGIALLPVWAVGAVFRVEVLRRAGGWWLMPFVLREAGESVIERVTAPRDGSHWRRPDPPPRPVDDPEPSGDWVRSLGVFLLWGLAIVGGLVLLMESHDAIVEPLAGGPAGEAAAVVIVLVTLAAAAAAWVLAQRYRYDSRPPAFRFALAAAIVCGFFSYSVIVELGYADRLVEEYCSYGAVSQRQLDTCQTHVSANHVREIDTPASRFAQGDSTAECGAGSGPFCQRVLDYRSLEEQQPPPGQ